MDARFEVLVTLDEAEIEREGKRRGFTLERAHETVIADVECRLHDSIQYRDGVERVGISFAGRSWRRELAWKLGRCRTQFRLRGGV